MNAAAVRARACWERACALGGFKGVDGGSIGAQIDAAVEVLSGPEKVAVRALLCEAWKLVSAFGSAELAAEYLKLAVAMTRQQGRVQEALAAAQVIEDAIWVDPNDGQSRASKDRIVVERLEAGLAECGFCPRSEEVRRG